MTPEVGRRDSPAWDLDLSAPVFAGWPDAPEAHNGTSRRVRLLVFTSSAVGASGSCLECIKMLAAEEVAGDGLAWRASGLPSPVEIVPLPDLSRARLSFVRRCGGVPGPLGSVSHLSSTTAGPCVAKVLLRLYSGDTAGHRTR